MAGRVVPGSTFLTIQAPYHPGLIAAIKEISGRRYLPESKAWTVPATEAEALLPIAREHGLDWPGMDRAVVQANEIVIERDAKLAAMTALSCAQEAPVPMVFPTFNGTLRHYQEAGVAYLLAAPRSIHADDMGLGKTAQALAAVEVSGDYPALVICPPRQNSCRLHRTPILKAAMENLSGSIRTTIQGKSGGATATAGECGAGGGGA